MGLNQGKLSDNIRIERLKRGFKQEYMAFMLDISQNAFSKIERGETEVTVSRLYQIAEVLDIAVTELLPTPSDSEAIDVSWLSKIWGRTKSWLTALFFPGK